MKLRSKIILVTLGLLGLVVCLCMIGAYVTIYDQNQEASYKTIQTAHNIISDDLVSKQNVLKKYAAEIIKAGEFNNFISFFLDHKKKPDAAQWLAGTFQDAAKALYNMCMAGNVWQATVFDKDRDAVVYCRIENDGKAHLGYFFGYPNPASIDLSFKAGIQINPVIWQQAKKNSSAQPPKAEAINPQLTVGFEMRQGHLCLVTYAPIFGIGDGADKKVSGMVMVARKIDQKFITRMAKLSFTAVNIFTDNKLLLGTLPEYNSFKSTGIKKTNPDWHFEKQSLLLDEATVGENEYFRGVLPLYSKGEYMAAITVLSSKKIVNDNVMKMITVLLLIFLGCILLAIPILWLVVNRTIKPIDRALIELNRAAQEVASAAGQISTTSQELAEGASQQAASLEETSSALEQMRSRARDNANSASQADEVMNAAREINTQAAKAMEGAVGSMETIAQSAGDTAKIVKSIDEIAFQTNLLALNAAVEAARAGEAGAGFAVVADEVRNLAMRAAEAAKNTQELIQDSVAKIEQGSKLVTTTKETFEKQEEKSSQIAGLVSEIASASDEQARGVDQIRQAASQINQVIQQTASSAEESASASEEMAGQAKFLQNTVAALDRLVHGNKSQTNAQGQEPSKRVGLRRLLPGPDKGDDSF